MNNNLSVQPVGMPGMGHFSASDLRRRGWTRRLIERFLGEPTAGVKPNPHVRRGRPMKLFDSGYVQLVESDPAFLDESELSRQRAALISQAAKVKTESLLRMVADIEIALPCWSRDQLASEAAQTFGYMPDAECAARRELSVLVRESSAEWTLDEFFWHGGIRQARIVLRRKILAAAIEQFPHLGEAALEWAKKENGSAEIEVVLD